MCWKNYWVRFCSAYNRIQFKKFSIIAVIYIYFRSTTEPSTDEIFADISRLTQSRWWIRDNSFRDFSEPKIRTVRRIEWFPVDCSSCKKFRYCISSNDCCFIYCFDESWKRRKDRKKIYYLRCLWNLLAPFFKFWGYLKTSWPGDCPVGNDLTVY